MERKSVMTTDTPPERVTLDYADGFYFREDSEVGDYSLWEELERRYNAHDDLVAALRDSVDVLVGHTYASVVKQAYEKAIAALAKAEGA